jgi:regulator of sigma E protease
MYFEVIAVLSLAIIVHEAGHLIAAKISGIPIAVFSVGFGPRLFGKKFGVTDYRLSLMPLGGYLMPAVNHESEFFAISPLKRAFFSVGGILANLSTVAVLFFADQILRGAGLFASLKSSVILSVSMMGKIAGGISSLFVSPENMSGIIGIVSSGGKALDAGFPLLYFTIIIHANLAFFNLLPIPALDGGKILISLLEKINSRFARLHIPLVMAGWIFIIMLAGAAIFYDIQRIVA